MGDDELVFGIIRPCTRHADPRFRDFWLAHLCGLCLALRKDYGQHSRLVTNTDAALIPALVAAQCEPSTSRTAGPCAFRKMKTATVVTGPATQLAAGVSVLLAAGKLQDHIADNDGPFRRRPTRAVGQRLAHRWEAKARRNLALLDARLPSVAETLAAQDHYERTLRCGDNPLDCATPTAIATAAAFAHTAVLAGKPGNAEQLAQAGHAFGELVYLLDAITDLDDDLESGQFNPLAVTSTHRAGARELAREVTTKFARALDATDLPTPTTALFKRESSRAVARAFRGVTQAAFLPMCLVASLPSPGLNPYDDTAQQLEEEEKKQTNGTGQSGEDIESATSTESSGGSGCGDCCDGCDGCCDCCDCACCDCDCGC